MIIIQDTCVLCHV